MWYFDKLKEIGMTLTQEAESLRDSAVKLKTHIDNTLDLLKSEYNPEAIKTEFEDAEGDALWLEDYTEAFLMACQKL